MSSTDKKTGGSLGFLAKTSDTTLLLTITIVVFFLMYIGAMIFQGSGFLKAQTFFNILNAKQMQHLSLAQSE